MTDQNSNVGQLVVQQAAQRARELAQKAARSIGTPLDAQQPSQEEQARLWSYQDPNADLAQVQQLVDAGQHGQAVDIMFPWRSKLIGNGSLADRVANAERLSSLAQRYQEQQGKETGNA